MPTIWYCSFSDYSWDNLKFKSQLTFSFFTAVNHRPVGRSGSKGCARTPYPDPRSPLFCWPPPPRSLTRSIFRAFFDSRSSFFAPKPRGNACYVGYLEEPLFCGSCQLQGVDFGSFFSWRRLRYALFLFLCGPYVFEGFFKYRLFSVDKKKYSRHKRDSLHCVINTSTNIHWSDRSHHASNLANNTDLQRSFYPFIVLNSDIPHFNSKKIVKLSTLLKKNTFED